jgi:hypothetical protein
VNALRNTIAPIAAVIVTAVYVVFVAILWSQVGNSETDWGRKLLLFSGVQAVTFSGVGWLFGKEVNKGAVNAAADANGRATEAARAHGVAQGKGEALAAAVRRASDGAGPVGGGRLEAAPADGKGALQALADDLFPAGP